MSKKVIFTERCAPGGLQCDACGYAEGSERGLTRDLVGTPCPRCGANMLTMRDYLLTEIVFATVDLINAVLGPIFGAESKPRQGMRFGIRAHGDIISVRPSDRASSSDSTAP